MFIPNISNSPAVMDFDLNNIDRAYAGIFYDYQMHPQWVDLDRDNDYDLVVGGEMEQIHYYKN